MSEKMDKKALKKKKKKKSMVMKSVVLILLLVVLAVCIFFLAKTLKKDQAQGRSEYLLFLLLHFPELWKHQRSVR